MSYNAIYWASFKARKNVSLGARTVTVRRRRGALVRSAGNEPEETTTFNFVRRLTSYRGSLIDIVAHSKGVEGPAKGWMGSGSDLVIELSAGASLAIQMKREDHAGKFPQWKPAQTAALLAWAGGVGALPYIGVIPHEAALPTRALTGCCMGSVTRCGPTPPKSKTPPLGFARPWLGGSIGGGLYLGRPPSPTSADWSALADTIAVECLYCPRLAGRLPAAATVADGSGYVSRLLAAARAAPAEAFPPSAGDNVGAADPDDELPSYSIRLGIDESVAAIPPDPPDRDRAE